VSVTSTADFFPLPTTHPFGYGPDGASLTNGAIGLGSDEALGGALLTPIPWLKDHALQGEVHTESTELVDGPLGTGSIETVTVSVNGVNSLQLIGSTPTVTARPGGAVTQGELIRQEQEAGIVPLSQVNDDDPADEIAEEHIHARGPEEVDVTDTGPQREEAAGSGPNHGGFDVEAALGRHVERTDALARSSEKKDGPEAEKKAEPEASADVEMTDDVATVEETTKAEEKPIDEDTKVE
jgi:hypothetical protein